MLQIGCEVLGLYWLYTTTSIFGGATGPLLCCLSFLDNSKNIQKIVIKSLGPPQNCAGRKKIILPLLWIEHGPLSCQIRWPLFDCLPMSVIIIWLLWIAFVALIQICWIEPRPLSWQMRWPLIECLPMSIIIWLLWIAVVALIYIC